LAIIPTIISVKIILAGSSFIHPYVDMATIVFLPNGEMSRFGSKAMVQISFIATCFARIRYASHRIMNQGRYFVFISFISQYLLMI